MFLTPVLTLLSKALKETFDDEYPVEKWRNLRISQEFPNARQDYPGIWYGFNPVGDMHPAGIGHREYEPEQGGVAARAYGRWEFQGMAEFTIVALNNRERASLFDELFRVFAFGRENPATSHFRRLIEENEYIGTWMDWDEIAVTGGNETPVTPWGSPDEVVYEITIQMEMGGDFVADLQTGTLVPLSEIEIVATPENPDGSVPD